VRLRRIVRKVILFRALSDPVIAIVPVDHLARLDGTGKLKRFVVLSTAQAAKDVAEHNAGVDPAVL